MKNKGNKAGRKRKWIPKSGREEIKGEDRRYRKTEKKQIKQQTVIIFRED